MKIFAILACLVLSLAQSVEDGVYVLNDENFEDFIDKNENVLVEFYAPWCTHCKTLAPIYSEAALSLADKVPLAKVDATEQKVIAKRFGVKGYPTLIFFKNGQQVEYNGGRTKETIVNWVLKKSGSPSQATQCSHVSKVIQDNKFVQVFNQGSDKLWEAHIKYASAEDKITFIHTTECSSLQQGVTFWRKFEKEENVYTGEETKESLVSFVKPLLNPTLFEFSEENGKNEILKENRAILILFRREEDAVAPFMTAMLDAAKANRGKMLFSYSDMQNTQGENIAYVLEVKEEEMPLLAAIVPSNKNKAVKCQTKAEDLTEEIITKFVDDIIEGKFEPVLKSQPIPENNDEALKVLVGKNFNQIVQDTTKDVFILFYAPWDMFSKKYLKLFKELADQMSDHTNLIIAKYDGTANEVDGLGPTGYPTVKLFKKNDKDGVEYGGERDLEEMKAWIRENAPTLQQKNEL